MTSLPAANYFINGSRTNVEAKNAQDSFVEAVREMPGGQAATTLTISGGSVTPDRFFHLIDTQAAASTDDLDDIVVTNHPDGRLLMIYAANATHTVVVRHAQGGSGQISTLDGTNVSLDDTSDGMLLQLVGTTWYERIRLGNIAVQDTTQTLYNKIFGLTSGTAFQINDTTGNHQYLIKVSELSADRNITLPLLTGNDDFVFEDHTQTLTNKSLTSAVLNTGVTGTAILDSDTMSGASATTLATSESIKAYADNAGMESGTRMLFHQTAAPTGWTRDTTTTTIDNHALRVVTNGTWGTGSRGGSVAPFTTLHSSAHPTTSVLSANVVSHSHLIHSRYGGTQAVDPEEGPPTVGAPSYENYPDNAGSLSTQSTAQGSAHAHTSDLRIKYVDLIIGTKN